MCMDGAKGGKSIIWENVGCPLCGAHEDEPLIVVPSESDDAVYRVGRCRKCSMAYLNPRPTEETVGCLYPDSYEEYTGPSVRCHGALGRFRHYLERLVMGREYGCPPLPKNALERWLAKMAGPWLRPPRTSLTSIRYQGEGRLLDFGCGAGWYLQRMRERGWNVTGLDFSAHAAKEVTQKYGIPVLVGTLPHPEVKPASFDVITMGAVLEHVHHPHEVIRAAVEALRPDGKLVIAVPNLDSWGFGFFGQDWWGLELPRHLLHFGPVTLRKLVEGHGLEVSDVQLVERGGWIRRSMAIVRRRPGAPRWRRFVSRLGRLRIVPSLLTRWTVWRGRQDCLVMIARKLGPREKQSAAA